MDKDRVIKSFTCRSPPVSHCLIEPYRGAVATRPNRQALIFTIHVKLVLLTRLVIFKWSGVNFKHKRLIGALEFGPRIHFRVSCDESTENLVVLSLYDEERAMVSWPVITFIIPIVYQKISGLLVQSQNVVTIFSRLINQLWLPYLYILWEHTPDIGKLRKIDSFLGDYVLRNIKKLVFKISKLLERYSHSMRVRFFLKIFSFRGLFLELIFRILIKFNNFLSPSACEVLF